MLELLPLYQHAKFAQEAQCKGLQQKDGQRRMVGIAEWKDRPDFRSYLRGKD